MTTDRRYAEAAHEGTVYVAFLVRVVAQVDLDTGEIWRVVVEDETEVGDRVYFDADGSTELAAGDPRAAAAEEVTQEVEWPAWEFGW